MRIGYVQTEPILGDVAGNLARAAALAAHVHADLLIFPELFATGYAHVDRDAAWALAEDADGPTIGWAYELSGRTGAAICGGYIRREGARAFNSAFLVDGEGLVATYDKIHLFHNERKLFDPGQTAPAACVVRDVPVGIMICYDWQFPELARSLALDGARILLHPSNLVLPWGQDAMRIRGLENGVFTVTANRVGTDGDLNFTGGSQITGPKGAIISQAPTVGEHAYAVEIEPDDAADKRTTDLADRFADRRPEFYARVTRR